MADMVESNLITFASWLVGDYSNWEQAIANPPFFAHVRVCVRPLPVPLSPEGIWLYVEQAYDYEINRPYRTAVLQVLSEGDQITIVNYKLTNPETYFGCARQPDRLHNLSINDLERQCGCNMLVSAKDSHSFQGIVEAGKQCRVHRKGKETYLHSEFEVGENFFRSLDQGYDLETNERVWGAIAGAFEFHKKASFRDELLQIINRGSGH
jgi:hypothetical protein